MPKFTLTHEIECSENEFWRLFLDRRFNEQLFREGLGFPQYEIVSQEETAREIARKVSVLPKLDLPGPVSKVMGSSFRYTEESSFDKDSKVWRWKTTPSVLADKIRNEGEMRIERVGDLRVRRITAITLEAKVFAIGSVIESTFEKALRDGWQKSADFMNQYLRTQPKT